MGGPVRWNSSGEISARGDRASREASVNAIAIERVEVASDDVVDELAAVLVDAVNGGSSVSFMAGAPGLKSSLDSGTHKVFIVVAESK